jgi:hypothetical protein
MFCQAATLARAAPARSLIDTQHLSSRVDTYVLVRGEKKPTYFSISQVLNCVAALGMVSNQVLIFVA